MEKGAWIIGDVHGCYATLLALLDKLPKEDKKIFVGDLIDRGPQSRKVIQLIKDNNYDCVLGNHEEMMIDAYDDYDDPSQAAGWFGNGGNFTYWNYDKFTEFEEDVEFLKSLPVHLVYEDIVDKEGRKLLVTHSAALNVINHRISSEEKLKIENNKHNIIHYQDTMENTKNIILWNRKKPSEIDKNDYFNVFGHTPMQHFALREDYSIRLSDEVFYEKKIALDRDIGYANIDTGAIYSKLAGKYNNKLTALHYPSFKLVQQQNIDTEKKG